MTESETNVKIFKEFGKLDDSEKREVIAFMQNLATMNPEQKKTFHELMEKTVNTIPENELNKDHSFYMRYAAECVLEGVTGEELLKEWNEKKGKGL